MTFGDYLQRMGEKFMPAAESILMEAEYREQKQGKLKDVQNYINAKHELFLMEFPNAQARDRTEFYRETTEGFLNKYVRDQMFCYEPADVESFGARAVNVVQIERRRIRIGDSDTKRLDGLVPVTRPIKDGPDPARASRRSRAETQTGDDSEGEDEAGQLSRKKSGRCHGIQPGEGPGGGAALAATGVATRKPKERGPDPGGEARLRDDRATVAALEFSHPPPSGNASRAPGSKGRRPALRAGDRAGSTERGQRENQSLYQGSEDSLIRALNGWGNPVKPLGGRREEGRSGGEGRRKGRPDGSLSRRAQVQGRGGPTTCRWEGPVLGRTGPG